MTQLRVSHLSDPRQTANAINGALRKTDALDLSADQTTVTFDRPVSITGGAALTGDLTAVNSNITGVYEIASVQVVGPRNTGWTADTGTAEKTAHATYVAGSALTFTDPPTAAEMSALATRLHNVELALQSVTRGQMAIKSALITHGLIGT